MTYYVKAQNCVGSPGEALTKAELREMGGNPDSADWQALTVGGAVIWSDLPSDGTSNRTWMHAAAAAVLRRAAAVGSLIACRQRVKLARARERFV